MTAGLAQSVQDRLLRHAHTLGVDPNLVLARYATERLLYRLSCSAYADRFVLKGALMLLVWLGEAIRPTRDADLLGFGDLSPAILARIFAEVCVAPVQPDEIEFDTGSIHVVAIRTEDAHGGQRVILRGHLGAARLRVQVDVGIGDAPVPAPEWLDYPSLLDLPRPRLRAYRPESTIAEKVHAMVALGSKNSRMRDFFDVYALAMRRSFDGDTLVRALQATFARRSTALPAAPPLALTPAFAALEGKPEQWAAFLRRSRLTASPPDLANVIETLGVFLAPVLAAAARGEPHVRTWPPGGPWLAMRIPSEEP